MKKIAILAMVAITMLSCTEDPEKVVLPTTEVSGEYVVSLTLPAFDVTEEHNIRVFNTGSGSDSLWVEDADFFGSQVRVKWDGKNSFSVLSGVDIESGHDVDITGQVFPENDSIHIEWKYYQVDIGAGVDDYVVTADGVLYNGLTN